MSVYSVQFEAIWAQIREVQKDCLETVQNIVDTLREWDKQSIEPSTESKGSKMRKGNTSGALRKYEMIKMNLNDTASLVSSITIRENS